MKTSILAGIVFSCLSAHLDAALVDQSYVPTTTNAAHVVGFSNGERMDVAQTFTVGISGELTGIDVWVGRFATAAEPLIYDVRRTSQQMPSATDSGSSILASGLIRATDLEVEGGRVGPPPSMLTHLDLSGTRSDVEQGDVLAIVLRSFDQGPRFSYFAHGSTRDPYEDGSMYRRFTGNDRGWELVPGGDWDIVFRTYLVPEPTSVLLLLLGVAVLLPMRASV